MLLLLMMLLLPHHHLLVLQLALVIGGGGGRRWRPLWPQHLVEEAVSSSSALPKMRMRVWRRPESGTTVVYCRYSWLGGTCQVGASPA